MVKTTMVGGVAFFAMSLLIAFLAAIPDEMIMEYVYESSGWYDQSSGYGSSTDLVLWIGHKLIYGLGIAPIYFFVRKSMTGPEWKKGARFGLMTWPLIAATYMGQSAIVGMPVLVWLWWAAFYLVSALASGAVMGWAVKRYVLK